MLMLVRSKIVWAALLVLTLLGAAVAVVFLRPRGAGPSNPGFQDQAAASGITFRMNFINSEQGENFKVNLYDHGTGVAVADYDGDGHDDIYLVNQLGPNALYKNKGDGTFVDVTQQAGVALGDRICVSATFADYDNDGRQDLFVTSVRGGNVLFHNQGDGTFKDVTKEAGVAHVGHSQGAVFFDYDNDGFLDLLVVSTGKWTTSTYDPGSKYYPGKGTLWDIATSPREFNILYHNNRDGTFTDVTDKSGLKGKGWAGDVAVFDYNEDGRPDVLITCMFGPSQLYRNNGDGTFTEVTREVLGRTPYGGMGAKVFDFNNDGKLDLYIVDMHSDMWMDPDLDLATIDDKAKYQYFEGPKAETDPNLMQKEKALAEVTHLPYEDVVFGNTFFKNLGNGHFEEMSDKAGLETFWPWGIAAGDFNNDGHEDLFIPSGMGYPFHYWPNYLLLNNGDETFTNRASAEGIEPPALGQFLDQKIRGQRCARSSRSAAVADFKGDGRLDIITNNFNDSPYYFRNHFPRKNYVAFRLTGTRSNRDALGAVVRLYVGQEIMTRLVQPAGGYLTQSSRTVHFGLGDRPKIDRVEIAWPSGIRQTLDNTDINRVHKIEEPAK